MSSVDSCPWPGRLAATRLRAPERLAMDMSLWRASGTAGADGPLGETTQADHPVIHDERAGHGEVDAEARGNPDDEVAACLQRRRETGALRAQHIGGLRRMTEARHVDGIGQQFHADEAATA